MRGIKISTALLCATALAGCNLAPDYAPPALTLPTEFKEAPNTEAGLWTVANPSDAVSKGAWWTAFQDPTLNGLEADVDRANPTLAAAVAAYDQSRAFAAEAGSALVPTVTGLESESYNRQSKERPLRGANQPNDYANNDIGFEVDYEFDFWSRIHNLVAGARAEAEATAADLATARLSLQAALANDYLQMRGLDDQAQLLATTVDAYQKALNLTTVRHDGGVASDLDVQRANTQLSSARAQISDIAAQRALYEHAIAALVGKPASSFSLSAASSPRRIPVMPAGLPSTLLQRRPDIAAAERRAYAANRQIGVAKAAYFPTLSLDAQGGFQNTGGNSLLIAPNTFWTLGPQLALTLFDGGRRKAGVVAAKAAFDRASGQYRAVVLAAFQDVEDQLALAHYLAKEAGEEAIAVKSAQATTRLSLIRYREGATNYLDVVTAQTAELQAEQTALALETRRQQAGVNLTRALGGGWGASAPS